MLNKIEINNISNKMNENLFTTTNSDRNYIENKLEGIFEKAKNNTKNKKINSNSSSLTNEIFKNMNNTSENSSIKLKEIYSQKFFNESILDNKSAENKSLFI